MKSSRVFRIPETGLCFYSFFLNFFWEVVQTYFYTMKDYPFSTMLYGWVHCTFGDVILTLVSFWLVSATNRNHRWFLHLNGLNLIGFITIGVVGTVISERVNVNLLKSWTYNDLMPIVPLLKVGLIPFFQWMIIPPAVLILVRHHCLVEQEATKTGVTF